MLAAGDPAWVLTWNLWWRFGDWRRRQEAIAATLTELRPDVCGLQEVWASPEENQAELLARQLQMHWVFTPSPDPGRWQQRLGDSGVAFGVACHEHGTALSGFLPASWDHLGCQLWDHPARLAGGSAVGSLDRYVVFMDVEVNGGVQGGRRG